MGGLGSLVHVAIIQSIISLNQMVEASWQGNFGKIN